MNPGNKTGSGFLAAGGVAAILASTCCLGPFLLVMLGSLVRGLEVCPFLNPTLAAMVSAGATLA